MSFVDEFFRWLENRSAVPSEPEPIPPPRVTPRFRITVPFGDEEPRVYFIYAADESAVLQRLPLQFRADTQEEAMRDAERAARMLSELP
jgi:hypothetical protein